jgi:hypothetical protein
MRTLLIPILALLGNIAFISSVRSAPFETLPDGRIQHTVSGFMFPERSGVFVREQNMHQFNQAGSDVSAGYNAGVLIAATVYVYPAPVQGAGALEHEYDCKRAEVLHGHDGVTILSESLETITKGNKKCVGHRAFFSFQGTFAHVLQTLKSQLLVFRNGPVFIEYRIAYPSDHSDEAEKQINNFVRDWSWRY